MAVDVMAAAVSVIFIPMSSDEDDRPAGVVMRIVITFTFLVIDTAAVMFEQILKDAVDIKSENDLTA